MKRLLPALFVISVTVSTANAAVRTNVVDRSYDRLGRRVRKNGDTFVYDGYLNVSQTVWDPTEPVATRPLVWFEGNEYLYSFHDGNKNVADSVSTSSSSAVRHYRYVPFGTVAGDSAENCSEWLFSSESYDGEVGLVYYNYRFYCQRNGVWNRRDTLAELAGPNLYLFVRNSPILSYDLLGESCSVYSGPYVVETKESSSFSPWRSKNRLVDYREVATGVYPLPVPSGGGFVALSKVMCLCTYQIEDEREHRRSIKEHKKQMVRCESKDKCQTLAITYEEDLGWFARTDTKKEKEDHGRLDLKVRPFGGGVVPVDCYTPCRLAMPR